METIAAIATAPGLGALGVLRLTGERAQPICGAFLRLKDGQVLKPRVATLAQAHGDCRPIDQVIATYFPAPHSATGEDVVEISAHGSPYILKELLTAALRAGARMAEPGEFTQRAFLNGRLDLAQAEAVCDLIRARTDRAHRAALSQLEGGLSKAVGSGRRTVLEILIRIEAVLDHPEEDIPALSPHETRQFLLDAQRPLRDLAGTFRSGRLLVEGARVCIVGRPNAGKSSLLNALLGTDRAIVCPTPGTTRDTIEEAMDLAGLPAVLIDTAGLRENVENEAEASGIKRSERALQAADLALLVIDGSRTEDEEDARIHRRILDAAARLGRPILTVNNKSDLRAKPDSGGADVSISTLTRSGLEDLVRMAAERLSQTQAPAQTVVITSLRHQQALERAAQALENAREAISLHPGRWEDRAASALRQSLKHLGKITGEAAPDEVLHGIFSRFCVGK